MYTIYTSRMKKTRCPNGPSQKKTVAKNSEPRGRTDFQPSIFETKKKQNLDLEAKSG